MSDPQMLIGGGARRRGRPPAAGVVATERLQFRLTASERKQLHDIGKMEGRPVAEVVRDAINEYVSDFRDDPLFVRAPGRADSVGQ
jgi:predicted DNA-binding protein